MTSPSRSIVFTLLLPWLGAAAGHAQASSPPVLNTGSTTAVGYQMANVSGSVDPQGHTLVMTYQFGPTTDYELGSTAASPATVSGSGNVAVTGTLNGQPGAVYHYRLCAQDETLGTYSYGSDQEVTFPTAAATTLAATQVTDLTAAVSGSFDAGGQPCTLSFQYGTDTSYGSTLSTVSTQSNPIDPTLISATGSATGLLPNTLYHYRLVAYIPSTHTTTYGGDMTFTTGPPATPPFGILIGGLLPNRQFLTPTANVLSAFFNTGSSPATMNLEYGTSAAYGTQVVSPTLFATSTKALGSLPLSGLTPETTYHYRFTASNSEGTTVSVDSTFTTPPLPDVTTGSVDYINSNYADLPGVYNPQGGVYTVAFDYGTTTAYGTTVNADFGNNLAFSDPVTTPQATGALLDGLTPGTTYHYRLKLTDSYGINYFGADATFTTLSSAQAWRRGYFNTTDNSGDAADSANPAGDGTPNLMKYALGLDPLRFSAPPQPFLKDASGDRYLCLTFYRNSAYTDLTYSVEVADSPGGPWTSIASSVGGAETSGSGTIAERPYYIGGGTDPGATSVTVQDTLPASQTASRFMRLRVTR